MTNDVKRLSLCLLAVCTFFGGMSVQPLACLCYAVELLKRNEADLCVVTPDLNT